MSEIENAVAALKAGSHQYVAPGLTPPSGTSFKTGDQIFLVVLPDTVKESPAEVARQLDTASGGKHVFAVIVGEESTGYSTLLRGNKAEDMFSKAKDITNTPQVAMGVYTTLVHRYQETAEGQQDMVKLTVTSTETSQPPVDGGGSYLPVMTGGSLLLAAAVGFTVLKLWQKKAAKRFASMVPQEREYTQEDLAQWARSLTFEDLPAEAERRLRTIRDEVLSISKHWEKVQGTPVGAEVQDICFNLIPRNLELYRSLPESMKNTRLKSLGVVPSQLIVESLDAIEEGMAQTRDAVFEGSVRDLNVEAIFARSKYEPSSLQL